MVSGNSSSYSTSLQSDIEDAIDDGVMVCIASGNHYQKSTITGDQDFDNLCLFRNKVEVL